MNNEVKHDENTNHNPNSPERRKLINRLEVEENTNTNINTSTTNRIRQQTHTPTQARMPISIQSSTAPIDDFLDRVGYNRYHYIMCLVVCLIFFVDGCEMIIVNLLLSSLQMEWHFSPTQRSLLSSSVFFGFFIGSFISGYLTNKFGRKWPSILATISITIFTSITPSTVNFGQLLILRILVGTSIGVVVPGATTIVTESIPTKYRSFTANILWILYPLGIIYICFISMYFIKKDQTLQWRNIWLVNSITSSLMIFICFLLKESPRYLILKGRFEEAFCILNDIGYASNIQITDEDKEKIISEAKLKEELGKNESKSDFNIAAFFTRKYLLSSILLSYLWFISSFISYGLLYILPKIFDSISKKHKIDSLKHMIEAMFLLFPCPLFRGLLSEWKVLGRKNSIIVGFAGAMISGIFCVIYDKHLSISSGMLKFCVNTSLGILSVYTSEVYPTNIRAMALGFGNSITRLGGIVSPFICEYLLMHHNDGPFYIFILAAFTGVVSCMLLPYETIGKPLDAVENLEKEKSIEKLKI